MDAPQLIGRYRPPKHAKPGDVLRTPEGRVAVDALLPAPIGPWPATRHGGDGRGGKAVPILHGDLIAAVRTESAQAVAHWWGVSRWTVQRWRRRLGVARMTEGTSRRFRELAADKFRPPADAKTKHRGRK